MNDSNMQKPIFPNAQAMDHAEAKSLAMRALVFSFSYGLIRLKKLAVSEEKFMVGLIAVPAAMLIVTEMLSPDNFWPWIAIIFYLFGGLFILLSIFKSNNPEEAMGLITVKNNWIIVSSVIVFAALTFGGMFYSSHSVKQDIDKIISLATNADITEANKYIDAENFGFPKYSEMGEYAPDTLFWHDYERCSKNPIVLSRLVKNELSKEITIRDSYKTAAAWPISTEYTVYNGNYPKGAYSYGFGFGKKNGDQNYVLKDLMIILPIDESKRKDRVIQHLRLINSLCQDQ
ncbi:hypothetical protein [Limnohabitans radicicola]|uniref:Uncharacterized protein n=1 Tax=Limnohabitans radicicola TaxID=2771427 RepID=A0A927IML3_9BURK|nr:hypothetical protein [Limnohabitans radicicola]MBD8051127.1 hypothetical protein [Limnohabitans radicicola]